MLELPERTCLVEDRAPGSLLGAGDEVLDQIPDDGDRGHRSILW